MMIFDLNLNVNLYFYHMTTEILTEISKVFYRYKNWRENLIHIAG